MIKIISMSLILFACNALGSNEINKSSSIKNKLEQLEKLQNNKLDLSEALNMNKKTPFIIPKMIIPKREIIKHDPLQRAEYANSDKIHREAKQISKKSKNIAKVYTFLSLYGMEPRENGDLPNEKEVYKLLKEKVVVLKSKKKKYNKRIKIKPVNKFKRLSKF